MQVYRLTEFVFHAIEYNIVGSIINYTRKGENKNITLEQRLRFFLCQKTNKLMSPE